MAKRVSSNNKKNHRRGGVGTSFQGKLQMLRDFFFGSGQEPQRRFTESDLSTCLRQSGYNVELAAEKIMTGQYQPCKKFKRHESISMTLTSSSTTTTEAESPLLLSSSSCCTTTTDPTTRTRQTTACTSTIVSTSSTTAAATTTPVSHVKKPSCSVSVDSNNDKKTSMSSSSSSALVTPKPATPATNGAAIASSNIKNSNNNDKSKCKTSHETPPPMLVGRNTKSAPTSTSMAPWKDTSWLLCRRWISDGINLQRNGSVKYQEQLDVPLNGSSNCNTTTAPSSSTTTASSCVRFKSTYIHGTLPKQLSSVLVPLLQANYIKLQVEALMEERNLNIGSHLALTVSVWIVYPPAFFEIFDDYIDATTPTKEASYSKQFFRQNHAGGRSSSSICSSNSKKYNKSIQEAAFALLEWAQYGQPLEKLIDNYSVDPRQSDDEGQGEVIVDDDKATNSDSEEEEETMPEWAQDVVNQNHATKEMETPSKMKVDLRPYQKQALNWMTEREKDWTDNYDNDSNSIAWRREQLRLLTELADSAAGTTIGSKMSSGMSASLESGSGMHLHNPISCDCGPVVVDTERISAPSVADASEALLRNPTEEADPSNSDRTTADDLTHPLWEKRYLCNATQTQAISFFVHPFFRKAVARSPPPPKPCRGGILADSMGLGKTVMLLSLIEASKQEDQEKKCDSAVHNGKQPTTTLVVTPLSLLLQWENEIECKTSLSHHVHYGDSKKRSHGSSFEHVDVVLTTYGSLQAEYSEFLRDQDRDRKKSSIFFNRWKRVILDECHSIKTPTTIAAKACCYLEAERRWCVSGTIIQNSLEDVFSLMRFLRHEPWCEYSFWKEAVTNVSDPSVALDRVKRVLGPVMLRRTKETLGSDGTPILTLPDVDFKTIEVEFTPAERQFYEALYRKSFDIFNGFIQAGTVSSSWLKIFSLLQRLRQTCSHVALTVKSHIEYDAWNASVLESKGRESPRKQRGGTPEGPAKESDSIDQSFLEELHSKFKSMQTATTTSNDGSEDLLSCEYASKVAEKLNSAVLARTSELDQECSICLENMTVENSVITPCFHIFCRDCLMDVLKIPAKGENQSKKFSNCLLSSGICPVCNETVFLQKILRLSRTSDGKCKADYLHQNLPSSEPSNSTTNEEEDEAREVLQTAMKGSGSSKLSAIHRELENVWREEPESKILIFSQFLGFLDILESSFKINRIPFSRLDGKMNLKERMAVLRDFGTESSNQTGSSGQTRGSVFLISMKAGGVGLNLVTANTVFIADPWWNGAVEQQCIDRINRIGQAAKKIRVRKFCVKDSIEERILELQRRKAKIATAALGSPGSDTSDPRPSLDDFKLLFQDR